MTTYPYQDPTLPVHERVADLVRRMTLDEKLAQMNEVSLPPMDLNQSLPDLAALKLPHGVGGVSRLGMNRSSRQAAEAANFIQHLLKTETRLGIPAFIIDEALHGLMAQGATSFPQAIALGCTWDPSLVEAIFTVAAAEMRARGGNWALSPVLDLGRDPRWGRTEETYGEDPYLTARMGVAAIRGLQGHGPAIGPDRVMATTKHFAVHGQPEAGNNCAPGNYAEREIREVFLEPFRAAVQEAGVASVMASYNEIDSIPAHINHWLLHDVLRGEWGFDGLITSDGWGIHDLISRHYVAADEPDAARQVLLAGVQFELDSCFASLRSEIEAGRLDEALIDGAVSQILRQKFRLGLFDEDAADPQRADMVVGSEQHAALALQAARQSIVLLKNDGLLPLSIENLHKVAVIGPNAAVVLQGGYSAEPPRAVSLLDGIRAHVAGRADVLYAEGCRITEEGGGWWAWWRDDVHLPDPDEDEARIRAAIEVAQQADVVILALGENESMCREAWSPTHLGDRDSLDLPGKQDKLLKAVVETGTPAVLLLFGGRPLSVSWAAEHVPAILQCWYLGQEGGTALAEVLFGQTNPSGHLNITIPRSVGQVPAYYYHKPAARRGYVFTEPGPLFPFGHGLSYTTFDYTDLRADPAVVPVDGPVRVSVTVTNIGPRAGDEVVQLYLRDCVSSVTRPVKELKGFQRISLQPGEQRHVEFVLQPAALSLLNAQMQRVVEPGEFEVMVGGSSEQTISTRFVVRAE